MRSLLVIAMLAACGGDDGVDLTGVYEVTSETGSEPCGMDAAITDRPPFIRFEKMDLFGQAFFTSERCTDVAGTDCEGNFGIFDGLSEPTDTGWIGELSSSSPGGGRCLLGYRRTVATLEGDVLSVDVHAYDDDVELAEADCEPEAAEARGDTMPCTLHESLTATAR